MEDGKNSFYTLTDKSTEKRPLGRRRWEDNVRM